MDLCLSTIASLRHRELRSPTHLAPDLGRRRNEFAFDVCFRTPDYEAAGTDQFVSKMIHDLALSEGGNPPKSQIPISRAGSTGRCNII